MKMIINFNRKRISSARPPLYKALAVLSLAVVWIGLASCSAQTQPGAAPGRQKLKVLATTTLVGDVVRQVGREAIDLEVLLPSGVDVHSFQYTPSDVRRVAEAEVIFLNGAGLEEFMQPLLESAGAQAELVEVSAGIPLFEAVEGGEHSGEDNHGESGDPHVWTDPANVQSWVDQIQEALSRLDPQNATVYQSNAQDYKDDLAALDGWIQQEVAQIAPGDRRLVSDHQIFTYFAKRYGFELVGALIPAYSTAAEPTAQDLATLEDAIDSLGVKAIFIGQTASPRLAERVAADTGVKLVTIYTGSLTDRAGPAASYLDYMRYNVQAIVNALK
jgi:ABC-type Zn uptake system ZnuABC Zn-binding protein ZnuA